MLIGEYWLFWYGTFLQREKFGMMGSSLMYLSLVTFPSKKTTPTPKYGCSETVSIYVRKQKISTFSIQISTSDGESAWYLPVSFQFGLPNRLNFTVSRVRSNKSRKGENRPGDIGRERLSDGSYPPLVEPVNQRNADGEIKLVGTGYRNLNSSH